MKTQFKDFSAEIWKQIHNQVEAATKEPGPHFAAFDADGTLWDSDAGNSFFNYQIDNKLVPLPEDAWAEVFKIKAKDPRKAFLWMAQVNKGVKLSQVQKWAKDSFEHNQIHIFPPIKKLIDYLRSKKVEIYVVTASVKWSVEPGVSQIGVDFDHVLGVQTKIQNGLVTDVQDGVITWREGKAEALLAKTKGKRPILACGNTMGDFWLLENATHVKIAVRTDSGVHGSKDGDISPQELALYKEASAKGWITHNFL